MQRFLVAAFGLVILVGAVLLIRQYFPQRLNAEIAEAQTAGKKETAKWKVPEGGLSNVMFDKPVIQVPKLPQKPAPRGNVIR